MSTLACLHGFHVFPEDGGELGNVWRFYFSGPDGGFVVFSIDPDDIGEALPRLHFTDRNSLAPYAVRSGPCVSFRAAAGQTIETAFDPIYRWRCTEVRFRGPSLSVGSRRRRYAYATVHARRVFKL